MNKTWQLQDAKSHFSELVSRASAGETHVVTKRGEKAAVLLGYEQYLELTKQSSNLLEVLRGDEPYVDLELERDQDMGREVEF